MHVVAESQLSLHRGTAAEDARVGLPSARTSGDELPPGEAEGFLRGGLVTTAGEGGGVGSRRRVGWLLPDGICRPSWIGRGRPSETEVMGSLGARVGVVASVT